MSRGKAAWRGPVPRWIPLFVRSAGACPPRMCAAPQFLSFWLARARTGQDLASLPYRGMSTRLISRSAGACPPRSLAAPRHGEGQARALREAIRSFVVSSSARRSVSIVLTDTGLCRCLTFVGELVLESFVLGAQCRILFPLCIQLRRTPHPLFNDEVGAF